MVVGGGGSSKQWGFCFERTFLRPVGMRFMDDGGCDRLGDVYTQ